ncbi:hypothetical protein WJX84_007629 [Apatococcus fuscideae]|uniref:Importin N-terminal domain-containing protein n=1 Tax=Apatococcus fuscideae TaxID=2026836 RepID=A0AAW1SZ49_9CHLO
MAAVPSPSQRLLDFSQPIDVPLLDATVTAFYGAGSPAERSAAEDVLKRLQTHPEAWMRVDAILEASKTQQTKFFALQILEEVVKYRWGALPDEQREGIKNYISNLIIKLSSDEATFRREKMFLNKLNLILVQILKQDWPHRWQSFIPDIIGASRTSETLCENSMIILKLLSEEVFDFSRGELTQAKTRDLKNSLNQEFRLVHELCLFVLGASQSLDLIKATLDTLHVFLSWVPLGYIFESNLLQNLLRLFLTPAFRNVALQCLTEIAALEPAGDTYKSQSDSLFKEFMDYLECILPSGTNIPEAYSHGSDDDQAFVSNLALFFTAFFKTQISVLEENPNKSFLFRGLDYLLSISFVDEDEIFKICLDYWNFFVPDVYTSATTQDTLAPFAFQGLQNHQSRKVLYGKVLSQLRLLMITRMAKPEEVIVVEDENGNIIRESMKDTDVVARYKTMHETLVYLCHLDHEDTEAQMLEKLRVHLSTKDWPWASLNTLCWAIGSISGSMLEEQENRFLVTVIRDLLNLCEITRGKDNKAVIASNIMYVVGQYPRFLRNHWKFLKTVVNKLFEFMHETHPGVQDMACETFTKLCSKCKRKFVVSQVGEVEPFLSELLNNLVNIIQDLETHQIHMFYEAVGLIIGAEMDAKRRAEYLARLMQPPNHTWHTIIEQARGNQEVLRQQEVIRNVQIVLQSNVSVCSSLGHPFSSQLSLIFVDMLSVYKMYSELISAAVASGGPHAARTSHVKLMRSVKKSSLRLIETFAEKCEDDELLVRQYIPAMADPVLGDYARNVPDARDAEVLSLFAALINKLKQRMEAEVPQIFEAVFECTLQMITKNFEDYPEHRLQFFSLLRAITNHCFATLFTMSSTQLKLVMDSIIWAFRHTERNIAETGLNLLLEMLTSFEKNDFVTQFHQTYYLQLIREIFAVMTDTVHKPGFKIQARILHHLFSIVSSGAIKAPLWDLSKQDASAYPNNVVWAREQISHLLTESFPNLRQHQVEACVAGMFELQEFSAFKQHLRDFLVQTKSFASQDNADLFAEEVAQQREAERQRKLQIPGLIHPHDQEEMTDG